MTIGIAKTQITNPANIGGGSGGGSGSILFQNLSIAGILTPVNLSAEGSIDFFAYIAQANNGDWTNDATTGLHSKIVGGYLRRNFAYFGPTGTLIEVNQTDSNWQMTTTIGDDANLGATAGNQFLNASRAYTSYQANNTLLNVTPGWGWRISAPGVSSGTRTLRTYFAFKSGGVQTTNQLQFTARLSDGSAPDQVVTVSPNTINKIFYRLDCTFQVGSSGALLFLSAQGLENVIDAGMLLGFQAATLF